MQEFNIEIKDKKGVDNVVADHLSRLILEYDEHVFNYETKEYFPDEQLFTLNSLPWYADIANCLANESLYTNLPSQEKKRLFNLCRKFYWEDPYLFTEGSDGVIRRCIPDHEQKDILKECHEGWAGGHLSAAKTGQKVFDAGFFWPTVCLDAREYVRHCDRFQRTGGITKRNEMPLTNFQTYEIFNVWGVDFMGPFPVPFGFEYILVAVDYTSKWVEATATRTCSANEVLRFVQFNIVARYGMPKVIVSDGGTHFRNSMFKDFLKKNGLKQKIATPYHPQTSGQVEVSNKQLKSILEKVVKPNRKD